MPPPARPATLPAMKLLATVSAPALLKIPPPPSPSAELSTILLSVTDAELEENPYRKTPPPRPAVVLPLMVLEWIVLVLARLNMPPPPFTSPPAELSLIVLPVIDRVPPVKFTMPPPLVAAE